MSLRVALSRFGCPYDILLLPYPAGPDMLAEVRLRPNGFPDHVLAELFPALRRRTTNRNDFGPDEVPRDVRQKMHKAAEAGQ